MKRALIILLLALPVPGLWAEDSADDVALLVAAHGASHSTVPPSSIVDALRNGLWNSNRTAVAVSIPHPEASVILVFMRRPDGGFLAADASRVEDGNFGKLGWFGRAGYARFESTPTRWLPRQDGLYQVVIQTRAWKGRQRYTVSEPLVIKPDGTVLYR